MDPPKPPRDRRRSKKDEAPVPSQHDGSLHEASWHHVRLHEEAVSRPHRCTLSGDGAEQEIRKSESDLYLVKPVLSNCIIIISQII